MSFSKRWVEFDLVLSELTTDDVRDVKPGRKASPFTASHRNLQKTWRLRHYLICVLC